MKNIILSAVILFSAQTFAFNSIVHESSLQFERPIHPGDRFYGPPRTARWVAAGNFRLPKLLEQEIVINVDGNYVNEIYFSALKNSVRIISVEMHLPNGEVLQLNRVQGTLGENQQVRFRVNRNYSLRSRQIVIRAGSPNLVGSRAELQVQLGLAN